MPLHTDILTSSNTNKHIMFTYTHTHYSHVEVGMSSHKEISKRATKFEILYSLIFHLSIFHLFFETAPDNQDILSRSTCVHDLTDRLSYDIPLKIQLFIPSKY